MNNKRSAGLITRLKIWKRKRDHQILMNGYAELFYRRLAKHGWTAKSYGFAEGGI